jgi:triacylglycerol lipase
MNKQHDARARAIRAMGNIFTPDVIGATLDLYAGELTADPRIECVADLAYGDEERQVLDLYLQADNRAGPLMLFVPGGGFDGGDKRVNDMVFGNVARWFASKGVAGAVMNYRLAPGACWPAGALDVHSAVNWLRREAASLGFDPDQIWLVGHSAGANHVATALLDRSLAAEPAVRGAALISGIYEPPRGDAPPGVVSYFGTDKDALEARSALRWARAGSVPIMLAYAEHDAPWLSRPSLDLAAALTERDGKAARVFWMRDHNHVSPIFSIGSSDEALGLELLDFMGHVPAMRGDAA